MNRQEDWSNNKHFPPTITKSLIFELPYHLEKDF